MSQAEPIALFGMRFVEREGAIRISIDEDKRIFTPLSRSSYAWERTYKKRAAVNANG